MRRIHVLLVFIAVAFLVLIAGWAFAGDNKAQGQPFQALQQQIDQLKAQIEAIQSTPGPAGPPGPQGLQGPPGTQGDPGTPGQNGLACWDLNGNGSCDSNEDKNLDSVCDALDCQGAPGARPLGVYDGSGLFLGYYNQTIGSTMLVFNPDIPAFISVMLYQPPYLSAKEISDIYFTSEDCQGKPYSTVVTGGVSYGGMSELLLSVIGPTGTPDAFYILDSEATNDLFILRGELKSNHNLYSGICEPVSTSDQIVAFPIKQVEVQLFNQTLIYPIVVKPIQ